MIPVTCGYARVSKNNRDDRNIETELRILEEHGIRQEHFFRDVQSGSIFCSGGWNDDI